MGLTSDLHSDLNINTRSNMEEISESETATEARQSDPEEGIVKPQPKPIWGLEQGKKA